MEQDANIRHELTTIIQNLPAEQIKIAVLKWLDEDGDLEALEQELEEKQKSVSNLFNGTASSLSPDQKAKAFREWAESHRHDLPLLSDEAISRESIYSNERL